MGKSEVVDKLGRPIKDLRISVTDQCNFRCSYCMPAEIFGPDYPFLKKSELLSYEEIIDITKSFVSLGVEKIRLTGGEPLMRKDLPVLVKMLNDIDGVKDIALTTNGVLLPNYASQLKAAGLQRVNISLDALDDDLFGKMNGRNIKVSAVLKGIEAAEQAGLEIKINMVVKKGTNDSQVVPMARYFKEKGHILRFIEFMDVGNSNGWNLKEVLSKKDIIHLINAEMPLDPIDPNYFGEVATRYRYADSKSEIGVISSVTDSFCSSCTRARLSADGKIYTCLFAGKGFDIRSIIRSNVSSDQLTEKIKQVWVARDDRYSDERMELKKQGNKKRKIEMSYIGG